MNGYNGTSVKNIADAVGIKDSSLYKHFKSKEEILNAIVLRVEQHMDEMSLHFGLPIGDDYSQAAAVYERVQIDSLIELSKNLFRFYLKDSYMSRFWKMGNMERFRNQEVYSLFYDIYLERSMNYQTGLFAEMMKRHIFYDADPQVAAMNFYAPLFFLLSKYAGETEKEEEALILLEKQVKEFCRIYRRPEEQR